MRALHVISLVLVIIGGINWGLIGLFDYNLVDAIFGTMSLTSRVIYTLVGIAGLWAITFLGFNKTVREN